MTNGEKYKTAHERAEAFDRFCESFEECEKGCPLNCEDKYKSNWCKYAWLDLEAEDEKPLPCPFCGGETIVRENRNSTHQVVCNSKGCWYCSKCETSKSDAIAAHNRVAKAVRESDGK